MHTYQFTCQSCHLEFEAAGRKITYQDPVFGAGWKRVADCPACGATVPEAKPKMTVRKNSSGGHATSAAGCATGACPWLAN